MDKKTSSWNAVAARGELADDLVAAFSAVSPFIEKHTALVCPDCENVCCIDKHGKYDNNDMIFMRALVAVTEQRPHEGGDDDPCRYLDGSGCSRARWERPFRCTHFFCTPLLKSLENDNAKLYRGFVVYLQYLTSVRQRMLEA